MKSADGSRPTRSRPPRPQRFDSLEIRWPDGTRETHRDIAPGGAVVFEQKAAGNRR